MPPRAYEGAQILHVGERDPKDKNYETSEVVLAAPGTIVAPIPKGMKPTMDNAITLLAQQLNNTLGKGKHKPVKAAQGATINYDPNSLLTQANNFASTMLTDRYNNKQLNYQYNSVPATQKVAQQHALDMQRDAAWQNTLAQQRQANATRLGGGGGGGGGGSTGPTFDPLRESMLQQELRSRERIAQMQQENQFDPLRQALLEMQLGVTRRGQDIDSQLGNRGLDIRGTEVGNQFTLGKEGNNIRKREVEGQLALGNRQVALDEAMAAYQRIMGGISEASLPGIRSGNTPESGIYG